jgi:GT2 family glycosyltransferase
LFLSHPEVKEVVIVVDGCSDGTIEYVKEASAADSRIRYVDNVQNKGLPYSRNKGAELACCEYSFTAEDDLELSPGFFATLFDHMRQANADVISGRNIFRFEGESKEAAIARTDRLTKAPIDRRLAIVRVEVNTRSDRLQPLLPAPMLARTDLLRKVGWDTRYRGNFWREESDFQLSAIAAGYRLAYCPHAMSFNMLIERDRGGVHASWGTRRVALIVQNNWRFLGKHRRLIAQEFGIRSRAACIAQFLPWITYREIIFPRLAHLKKIIVGG